MKKSLFSAFLLGSLLATTSLMADEVADLQKKIDEKTQEINELAAKNPTLPNPTDVLILAAKRAELRDLINQKAQAEREQKNQNRAFTAPI